jgi:hypothetical protein
MKWFKHDTDASNDPKIRKLKKKFGMAGYGIYFNLLEIVARKMEDKVEEFGYLPVDWDDESLELEFGQSMDKLVPIIDYILELQLFERRGKQNRLYNSKIQGRCDDYTARILRNKPKELESPNTVRTKSDKVPLDKNRIDKNTITTKVVEGFNSNNYIKSLIDSKQEHIKIIGHYMEIKKMRFPSEKAAKAELGRSLKSAVELAEYPKEKRTLAVQMAAKQTNQWTLLTVVKYLNK